MSGLPITRAEAKARLEQLSLWSGQPEFTVIEDGRTNHNFAVRDATGLYFARMGIDLPHHFIFREHEQRAALLADKIGVAPRVLYAQEGVLVTEFLEARGLLIADGADTFILARIAGVLRRLHQAKPDTIELPFDLTRILPSYCSMLSADALEEADLRLVHKIILEIPALPATSLIHSDLIPNNFLYDGRELKLIDWEYAGLGHPAVDLAMIVSNFDLTEDQARFLVSEHGLCTYAEVCAMTPALIVRELLWTLVQIDKVGLQGDLPEYRELCFKRLRECAR